MAQTSKFYKAGGGLDFVTPSIEAPPGGLIGCDNYEAHSRGYIRTGGYERFDGNQKPSTASYSYLNFDAGTAAIAEGNTVTGATSGATGVALINAVVSSGSYGANNADGYLILGVVTGTFQNNENLQVSGATKVVADGLAVDRGAYTDTNDTTWLRDAMETARGNIIVVPGSGNIRGVCTLGGVTFAFRDNSGGSAVDCYKSTVAGWVKVALGYRIPFTSGSTALAVGATLTGDTSSATATLTRIALQSGSYAAGDAAGYFIFASDSGTFQAEEVNSGSATIAADSVANTLVAGGRFEFAEHNFGGHSGTNRIYGVDGVSMAFEFDGTVFVPIPTGMTTDTPVHIAVHLQQLFLSFSGGSLQNSGVGLPYQWTPVTGAAEIAIGHDITGLYSDVRGHLVIGARNMISVLYGQDVTNFELVPWSDESGVIEWSMQKLGDVVFIDDIGLRKLSAARDYGNFNLATLTRKIETLFREKRKSGVTILASIRTRSKDMYRVFFSDKTGISVYFGNDPKKPESMTFTLPVTVNCAYSGQDSSGNEILLFGSSTGYVYELDAGPNHDSAEIAAFIRFPFNHLGTPTQNKQYFRATLEVDASPNVELSLVAEYSYASPSQPPGVEHAFSVKGGGGFWEEQDWDEYYWSSPVEGLAAAPLDGLGTNISIAAISAGTYDDPHGISGVTLHFSPRGLVR